MREIAAKKGREVEKKSVNEKIMEVKGRGE